MDYPIEDYIFSSPEEICDNFSGLRANGQKLVTTNGCFDILHSGHIQYLIEAKAQGDILIVGVNSDASVHKLKGPTRPIQDQQTRQFVLAALRMVDGVFIFDEDDPRAFLEILRPDVHVKGGDYNRDILERPVVEKHGGIVKIVSLTPGQSTTTIVEKIMEHTSF